MGSDESRNFPDGMQRGLADSEKGNSKRVFQKPYHFSCTQCGKCCSDPHTIVTLTYYDLLRFHKMLGMDLSQILNVVGFYVFEEGLNEEILNKMVLPPIETENGPAFMGLKKDADGKCIFLKQNRCMIYHARPDICRTFPFHFSAKPIVGKKKEDQHLEITMSLTKKGMEYCEGLNTDAPVVKSEEWMEIGKETVLNIVEEAALINEWNNGVKRGKIAPSAKNYIATILNWGMNRTNSDKKEEGNVNKKQMKGQIARKEKTGKKNYKKIAMQRLKEREEQTRKK